MYEKVAVVPRQTELEEQGSGRQGLGFPHFITLDETESKRTFTLAN